MFSRTIGPEPRDPYFRAVHLMQLIMVVIIIAGLIFHWWEGAAKTFSGFGLMSQGLKPLLDIDPDVLGQPLLTLWLLWPAIVIAGMRGVAGVLVTPVSFRLLSLVALLIGAGAVGHFYINFGVGTLPDASPLPQGEIQIGFWISTIATVGAILLTLVEYIIQPHYDPFAKPLQASPTPVTDPERLWQGDYKSCPYCGTLNEPGAKACYGCHNLLFNFMDEKTQS